MPPSTPNRDALTYATNLAHDPSFHGGKRRLNGTQQEWSGHAHALQWLSDNARFECRDVCGYIRQLRHPLSVWTRDGMDTRPSTIPDARRVAISLEFLIESSSPNPVWSGGTIQRGAASRNWSRALSSPSPSANLAGVIESAAAAKPGIRSLVSAIVA